MAAGASGCSARARRESHHGIEWRRDAQTAAGRRAGARERHGCRGSADRTECFVHAAKIRNGGNSEFERQVSRALTELAGSDRDSAGVAWDERVAEERGRLRAGWTAKDIALGAGCVDAPIH